LTILSALEDFGTGKASAARDAIPIGEELTSAGGDIPDVDDPRVDQVQLQLQALRDEPLDE
jgi:hypothetical protein